jgi:hypothetical protein
MPDLRAPRQPVLPPGEGSGRFAVFGDGGEARWGRAEFFGGKAVALKQGVEAARGLEGSGALLLKDTERFDLVGEQETAVPGGRAAGEVRREINRGRVKGTRDLAIAESAPLPGKPEPATVEKKYSAFHCFAKSFGLYRFDLGSWMPMAVGD